MLENSVVQISTGKLLSASLLPSSILLVSGFIIWRIWLNKQSRLQTKTDVLHDELRKIKKQLADLQTAKHKAESDEFITDVLNDELGQIKKLMADLQTANHKVESGESMQTVNTSASVAQQTSQKSAKSLGKMGLFEFLIEDNIQLRKPTS